MTSNHDLNDDRVKWVSKSQLMLFYRCRYMFWLIDSGQLAHSEAITPQQSERITDGIKTHAQITTAAKPLILDAANLLEEMQSRSITLLNVPVFKNEQLMICGQPDGIVTEKGALLPLEIKSRKERKPSDKIELAFYWLLLEPFRTRHVDPHGILQLHGIGELKTLEIQLPDDVFLQVHELLADLRRVRIEGTKPQYHNCPYCNGPIRELCLQTSQSNMDVTLIRGIGPAFQKQLQKIGITNYVQLLHEDKHQLCNKLRIIGSSVSSSQIEMWQHHANSFRTKQPVVFRQLPVLPDSYIAMDLEYVQSMRIWLVGIAIVDGNTTKLVEYWAENEMEELDALDKLATWLTERNNLTVITWNGKAADLPQLTHAASRHPRLKDIISSINERHVDLLQIVTDHMRLPIPETGLHRVADYYQLPQSTEVFDGLQAAMLYQHYTSIVDSSQRQEIKRKLIDYSRHDLLALTGIVAKIRSLNLPT